MRVKGKALRKVPLKEQVLLNQVEVLGDNHKVDLGGAEEVEQVVAVHSRAGTVEDLLKDRKLLKMQLMQAKKVLGKRKIQTKHEIGARAPASHTELGEVVLSPERWIKFCRLCRELLYPPMTVRLLVKHSRDMMTRKMSNCNKRR